MKIEEEIKKQYNEGIVEIHRVYDIFKDFFDIISHVFSFLISNVESTSKLQ